MELPDDQRAELTALLFRSFEPDDEPELSEAEWQEEWGREIQRRAAAVRDGTTTLHDGEEVLRELRAKLSLRRP